MSSDFYRSAPMPLVKRFYIAGIWALCIALPVLLIVRVSMQFFTPPPANRLLMERDIPLPDAFPDPARTAKSPFTPGAARLFDHFNFQMIDPQTHLLFLAHTGPNPNREHQVNSHFDPDKDAKTDGNIVIFNILQQKIVALLPIPQVTGMALDPDSHHIFAADSNDSIIYDIDEATFKARPIHLQENDKPDTLA